MSVRSAVALARMNAAACEMSKGDRCRCHCAGALHGKQHSEAHIVAAALESSGAPESQVLEELNAQRERAATLRSQLALELEVGGLVQKASSM